MSPSKRALTLFIAVAAIAAAIIAIQQVVPQKASPSGTAAASPSNAPSASLGDSAAAATIPEPRGIAVWINSEPLTIASLRGKVVLVDFWTYSCINCIRTLPYLKEWHAKYASRGLVIVGVHTPEFEFEKDINNVRVAVQKYGVTWPVALDNDYATWRAYANRFWPHKYLADGNGRLRYHHIGEGAYMETEQWIRKLLAEAGYDVSDISLGSKENPAALAGSITRELYAGSAWRFGLYVGNPPKEIEGTVGLYTDPGNHDDGKIYYSGKWQEDEQFMRAVGPGPDGPSYVVIRYHARSANVVVLPQDNTPFGVVVQLDGKPVPKELAGDDITYDGSGRSLLGIDVPRMYNVVRGPKVESHELKLITDARYFNLYTFAFSP
jgi:thiol-disulfide isomerase/thioredoxin